MEEEELVDKEGEDEEHEDEVEADARICVVRATEDKYERDGECHLFGVEESIRPTGGRDACPGERHSR